MQQIGTRRPEGMQQNSLFVEAKTFVWKEFDEGRGKFFWAAFKKFWQAIRWLKREKQGLVQAAFSRGGELLTLTGGIVEQF